MIAITLVDNITAELRRIADASDESHPTQPTPLLNDAWTTKFARMLRAIVDGSWP
jgi:hypothetical protein